jgi:hypothetical protein
MDLLIQYLLRAGRRHPPLNRRSRLPCRWRRCRTHRWAARLSRRSRRGWMGVDCHARHVVAQAERRRRARRAGAAGLDHRDARHAGRGLSFWLPLADWRTPGEFQSCRNEAHSGDRLRWCRELGSEQLAHAPLAARAAAVSLTASGVVGCVLWRRYCSHTGRSRPCSCSLPTYRCAACRAASARRGMVLEHPGQSRVATGFLRLAASHECVSAGLPCGSLGNAAAPMAVCAIVT